jgi:hypothetical protein
METFKYLRAKRSNMNKLCLAVITILSVSLASSAALASQSLVPAYVTPANAVISVPEKAIGNSPALEKYVFIHYKKGFAKPNGAGAKQPACYAYLSKGAKLKGTKNFVVSPALDAATIWNSGQEWESHTSANLFGTYSEDSTANWDGDTPDGRNEFSLGNYPKPGVIAVTVIWGYFSGPPQTREITEFDVMFDTDYTWGDVDVSGAGVMDWQNIATHEIGHGTGLADLYNTCAEETMYGYSEEGETKKRTLNAGDIAGLQKLYGV